MNYGVIGNCKSAAVLDDHGCMIWCCLPDFDSSSIFAAMLDDRIGGRFGIEPASSYTVRQQYVKNTNILETTFTCEDGTFRILDFMPRYKSADTGYVCPPELSRLIRLDSGTPQIRINYDPRLGYAEHDTTTEDQGAYIKSCVNGGNYESVYLYTDLAHADITDGSVFALDADAYLVLSYHQKIVPVDMESVVLQYEKTKVYWLDWIGRTISFSEYVDAIRRSALVLKMLSYQETGAILAAVTTSLPESVGEERNWDYRFCWIRDSSMILSLLTKIGHFNVAENFCNFLLRVVHYKSDRIQIMYGIRGQKDLTETTLDWLEGYQGSKPVRVGNAAYIQKQNDIYGVLLDVIYKYIEIFPHQVESVERLWTITRTLVRTVSEQWHEPDMGIWEFRHHPSHFVFSKMLCWLAAHRGSEIAELLHRYDYAETWRQTAAQIKAEVLAKGWSEELGSFTQVYGASNVDASNLLMASYGFLPADDPRFVSTVKVTQRELSRDGLMFRYKSEDDFGKPKSCFTVCSFWLVKALWQIGEKAEARALFEKLLGYRNPLGLMSEDLDFDTKELLGNFPQGYSHLALIDCALTLNSMTLDEQSEIVEAIAGTENID